MADISSGAVKAIGGDEVTKITTKVVSMREEKQDGAKAITLAPTMALGDVPFELPCTQHDFRSAQFCIAMAKGTRSTF